MEDLGRLGENQHVVDSVDDTVQEVAPNGYC